MPTFSRLALSRQNQAAQARNTQFNSPLMNALNSTITQLPSRRIKGHDLGGGTLINWDKAAEIRQEFRQGAHGGGRFGGISGASYRSAPSVDTYAGEKAFLNGGGVAGNPGMAGADAQRARFAGQGFGATGSAGTGGGYPIPGGGGSGSPGSGGYGGAAGGGSAQQLFQKFIDDARAEAELANKETQQRIDQGLGHIDNFLAESRDASGANIRGLVEDTKQRHEAKNAQIMRDVQEQFAQSGRALNPRTYAAISKRLALTSGDAIQNQQSELEIDAANRLQRAQEVALGSRLDILGNTDRQTVDPSLVFQLANSLGEGAAAGGGGGGGNFSTNVSGQLGSLGGASGYFGGGSTKKSGGGGLREMGGNMEFKRTDPFMHARGTGEEELAGGPQTGGGSPVPRLDYNFSPENRRDGGTQHSGNYAGDTPVTSGIPVAGRKDDPTGGYRTPNRG